MKKWYHSKKFWSSVLPAFLVFVDVVVFQLTGHHIPLEGLGAAVATSLGYIFMEGANDRKGIAVQKIKEFNPLHDPMFRDLITSFINNQYDFAAAKEDLGLHTGQIVDKVISSIAYMLRPDDDYPDAALGGKVQEVRTEVARQVLKLYEQDTKLMEGHQLAKVSGK